MSGTAQGRSGVALLVIPLVLFMLVFYAAPVLSMLSRGFLEPAPTLSNYERLSGDAVFAHVLGTTARTAFIVTLFALLLGYPVALALARSVRGGATVILVLILLPFWTSVLVRSYAWMVVLGRHGLLNEMLTASGTIATPLRLLNTPLAVHVAMIHILLPYMILPIAASLKGIDAALPRAASGLGARPVTVFARIILPLSAPGIAAGVLLVFVQALGFYITPALVGGPRDLTLSMLIAQQVDLLNWPYAACLSTALLVLTLLTILVFQRLPGVRDVLRTTAR